MFCFNKAGIALKVNGYAIIFAVNDEEEGACITKSPVESELNEASWVLSVVVNPFDDTEGILEVITHKGYVDFNLLTSDSFTNSVKSQWKKHIKELKTHEDLTGF